MTDLDPRRKFYVTASDVGALMGDNPFKSREDLLREKVHGSDFDGNSLTIWGHWMEPVVLKALQQGTDLNPTEVQEFLARAPLGATPDAAGLRLEQPVPDERVLPMVSWQTEPPPFGEPLVIELKTTEVKKLRYWNPIPKYYWWQMQCQMYVTGYSWGILAACVGRADIRLWTVGVDTFAQEVMISEATKFLAELEKARSDENVG